jgi:ribonuclease VapC
MTCKHLLDASALLALIFNEPGAARVWAVLDDSCIHAINLAEVARKMVAIGMPAGEVEVRLAELNLEILEEFGMKQALAVGRLGLEAKRLGLSLGDSVCLVIAEQTGSVVVTTERRWSEVAGLKANILRLR